MTAHGGASTGDVLAGVDNAHVADMSIGDDAWIAAGFAITEDVFPGTRATARARRADEEGRGGERDD